MSLKGFRLLDLTRNFPGPFATHILADMGMEVIKIEEVSPRGGVGRDPLTPAGATKEQDRRHAAHNALARNKKSLALDLVAPEHRDAAREVLHRLVRESHVVIEAFRPGVVASRGADYDALRAHNPSIIYCSMSAFGQDGPYAGRPAHGGQMESISGVTIMDSTGQPIRFPVPVADTSGAFFAVASILAALIEFQQTGKGCHIDVSMSASALALLVMHTSRLHNRDAQPQAPSGPRAVGFLQCSDGKWISTGNLETYYWERFCNALGRPDWIPLRDGPDDQVEAMATELHALFASKPRDEWLELLVGFDTCVGAVNSPAEAFNDPQMVHVGMRRERSHPEEGLVSQLGFPVRVDGEEVLGDFRFAPALGADTADILRSLHYTDGDIARLAAAGTVKIADN